MKENPEKHIAVLQESNALTGKATEEPIKIESTAAPTSEIGVDFRGWHYVSFELRLKGSENLEWVFLDTGCTITLIDEKFLARQSPQHEIKHTEHPVRVCGIGSDMHEGKEYVVINVEIPCTLPDGKKSTGLC